jgi:hypothetical protein
MLNPEAELQGVKRKYGLSIILRDIQEISSGSLDKISGLAIFQINQRGKRLTF